jgi:hypothetical protein
MTGFCLMAARGDFSQGPKFAVAMEGAVYYGPVAFRECGTAGARVLPPALTLSLAGASRDFGASAVEECNPMDERLKFVARLVDGEKMAGLWRALRTLAS